MEKGYKNISFLFIAILAIIVLGFYKTYFGLFPKFDKVTTIQHIHGLLFTTWFLLLIIQPLLIRYKKYKWHRILGRCTYVLVPLLIISIHFIAQEAYLNAVAAHVPQKKILVILYFPTYQILDFALLYLLAIANVKNTPSHMRYMITTSLAIVGAGMRRVFLHWFGMSGPDVVLYAFLLTDSILIGLIFFDRIKGSTNKAYLISLGILAVSQLGFYFIPNTAWWQSVCGYFTQYF